MATRAWAQLKSASGHLPGSSGSPLYPEGSHRNCGLVGPLGHKQTSARWLGSQPMEDIQGTGS